MKPNSRVLSVFIIVTALLLRGLQLGSRSFWLDEAYGSWSATLPMAEIWNRPEEPHPPLYYLFLHVWTLAGHADWFIRLPSLLASLFNLALFHSVCRVFFNNKTTLFALGLLALNPLSIWYAQEARMYVFVATAALLMVKSLQLSTAKSTSLDHFTSYGLSKWRQSVAWTLFGLALTVGLYLDYTMIIIWILVSAHWILTQHATPHQIRGWTVTSLIAWLLFLPWLPNLYFILRHSDTVWVVEEVSNLLMLPINNKLLMLPLLLLFTGSAWSIWQLIGRRQHYEAVSKWLQRLMLFAFILLMLLSPIPRLYGLKKILMTGIPLIVLAVAWAWQSQQIGRVGTTLIFIFSLIPSLFLFAVPKDDWRAVVAKAESEMMVDEILWVDVHYQAIPYWHYANGRPVYAGIDSSNRHVGPFADLAIEQSATEIPFSVKGVWLVASRFPGESIPSSADEHYFNTTWELEEEFLFYRLALRHYRVKTQSH